MPSYRGGCHCGRVSFEVEGELEGLEVCNCSYCARAGYLHWYVTPDRFQLRSGDDVLRPYQFGTFSSRNLFCGVCGISPFRRPRSDPDKLDVNVRCLEGVDADALPFRRFDGRNWEQAMRAREHG